LQSALRAVFPFESIPETRIAARSLVIQPKEIGRSASADDVLDAIVATWTALRFANGVAEIISIDPQRDKRGLLMQMVF
jgi:predicted RNase H-like nuclease